METPRTQKDEEPHVALPNNPFIPRKDDVCFISKLPPELLSRTFAFVDTTDGYEDHMSDDHSDNLGCRSDGWKMEELEEDGEDEDEAETVTEAEAGAGAGAGERGEGTEAEVEGDEGDNNGPDDDSLASRSSDFPPRWLPFPIIASHVCRYWRNVAYSTPSLWTTIEIYPIAGRSYELESMLLERSKTLPIDLWVKCDLYEHDVLHDRAPSNADFRSILTMLIPHIRRWRTMEVSVSDYHLMYAFLSAVSDPFVLGVPQLTTLKLYHEEETIEFDTFWYPSMSKHFTLFGGSAPLLTTIVLWGVHVDWDQPWIVSASNLTDLTLAFHPDDVRPSWAQFASILRGAPFLEKLTLCLSGPSGDPEEWLVEPTPEGHTDLNAPVQLPRATHFALAFRSQACAIGLLRRFYLPALKDLNLRFVEGDFNDFVHELAGPATSLSWAQERPRSLLGRLESLEIVGLPCRGECAETLYSELQNLTTLNISMTCLPTPFLEVLSTPCTLTGRGDIWLPRLVALCVSGVSDLTNALREVVTKRREAGVPLSTLYLDRNSRVYKKDVEYLRENVKTLKFFDGM